MNEELRTPSVGRMPPGTADFDLDMLDKAAWGSKAFVTAVSFKTKNPLVYHVDHPKYSLIKYLLYQNPNEEKVVSVQQERVSL